MPKPLQLSGRALSWALLTAGTLLIVVALSLFVLVSAGVVGDKVQCGVFGVIVIDRGGKIIALHGQE